MSISYNFIPGTLTKITEKQKIFALFWLLDPRSDIAAIKAGYSRSNAKQRGYLLKENTNVRAFMIETIEQIREELKMGVRWKYCHIKNIVDQNAETDPRVSLSGIDILNKMEKVYAEDKGLGEKDFSQVDKEILDSKQKPY